MKKSTTNRIPAGRKHSLSMARYLKLTAVFIMLAVVWILTPGMKSQTLPPDAKPTCVVSAPTFANWFESGVPSLNGVVKPANSVTFPNVPNCSFYQWSEQMFLWLTSPTTPKYGGSGRIFDSPVFYDVSPPDQTGQRVFIPHETGNLRFLNLRAAQVGRHGLPVVVDKKGRLLEVETPKISANGRQLVLNSAAKRVEVERATLGANRKLVFIDKTGKTIANAKPIISPTLNKRLTVQKFMIDNKPVFVNSAGAVIDVEEGQAGGGDALLAQKGQLIYYATMVNDVYAYFLTGAKDGGILPAPTQFPTTQASLNQVIAFASAHGKTLVDPEALAIEVKSSWVIASTLPDPSNYITMTATVPTYNAANPNQWVPNGQRTVTLAMVGIHVVGSTAGHPEMIWATFEHFGNTPNAAYKYITTGNAIKTVPQSTAGSWLFSSSGTAGPFNNAHAKFVSPNIESVAPFTISPSDTMRMMAFGAAFDTRPNPAVLTSAGSNTEVIAINNSVLGQLIGGDVRGKYYMTGSTWTAGGAAPNGSFHNGVGNEVGTSLLANSTMETYQQNSNNTFGGSNCFSCHLSNDTGVSHIYDPLQPLF